jgi:predicted transposase/invertase (TIGR01784 family)
MLHDPLFKELLREFFREFLEMFYPDVAARLDFTRVTFLDKEVFTDFPEGSRRELDLVARVYTLNGELEVILIHIEVQAQRESDFASRMFDYCAFATDHPCSRSSSI